ncbi:MAG: 2-C-methyl-D-erythritol 4-phosphate cytidylyltransferase [Planctomycetes bacterium]|nr:2-C-methyl-D-erythritol 4-phosphate cytidylyltransferase [Planctomycetota bacterium]
MSNILILPCAGSGERFGACKQLQDLQNRAIFLHALDAFCDYIDHAIIPCSTDIQDQIANLIAQENFPFSTELINGGSTRFESVHNAIKCCPPNSKHILIHDAVRPFVKPAQIQSCLDALIEHDAVILGVPCRDSLKKANKQQNIEHGIDREQVWLAQTPQCIRGDLAAQIYQQAADEVWDCSDDAGIFEQAGHKVHILLGSTLNIKLTWPEDWLLAEQIAQLKP